MTGEARRGAFLDRDGVLNVPPAEHAYVTAVDDFSWLPGARSAVADLKRAGYRVAVVSNQRGVARGLVDERVLAGIEQRIQEGLRPLGAAIDGFYYCVHDLDAGCDCRKPAPGLIVRAATELGIDRARSVVIGDQESDVAAGRAAGCRTVLVSPDAGCRTDADDVAADLRSAVRALLEAGSPPDAREPGGRLLV